jgi:hypothetical protein
MYNLKKRHIVVIDWCCMCKRDGLLLHCEVVCALWSTFLSRFGLSWVIPRRVASLLVDWWYYSECCCVKNGDFLSFVVSLERTR